MRITDCVQQTDGRWRMGYAVDTAEFTAVLDVVWRQMRRNFHIEGYPNGKAPRAAIEAERGKDKFWLPAINYCIDHLLPPLYFAKLEQLDLHPLCWPEMELLHVDETGFEGIALISLIPEVLLPEHVSFQVDVVPEPVTAQMVGAEIEKLREQYAQEMPLAPDEQAKRGDVLLLDFEGRIDGVPFPGGNRENYRMRLGKNQPFPGFYERLKHAVAGRTYRMQTTFPFYMLDEELDGKTADFSITVKEAFRRVLALPGDELARRAGYTDYESLRQALRMELERGQALRAYSCAQKKLLEQFAAGVNCLLPETALDARRDELYLAFKQACIRRNMGYKALIAREGLTEEQYLAHLREQAARQLAGTAGLIALARREKLPIKAVMWEKSDGELWPTDGLTPGDRAFVYAAIRFLSRQLEQKGTT